MNMNPQKLYEKALNEFKDRVIKELNGEIDAIIVYGSVARGEANLDSDIDILILGNKKEEIRDKVSKIRTHNDLKYETLTTLTYLTQDEFEERLEKGEPFLKEIIREGFAIYGRKPSYKGILQASRQIS